MKHLLFIPMSVCLFAGFWLLGLHLYRTWSAPNVFFPKTVAVWRERMLRHKTNRIIYERYEKWCGIAGGTPEAHILLSLIGGAAGFVSGILLGNIVVSLSLFVLLVLLPTLLLYARYTVRINKKIGAFCRFVDLFARYYSSRKNIILTFRDMVEECPKELLPDLLLLNNHLSDGGNPVRAVEIFAERINHPWAHDFAMYAASGLEGETEDIQSALNRLTNEMFIQQDEKEERNSEIYAIWVSLILVILICICLIPYNQSLLKDSYRLYFFTADGQAILSLAVTVWALSILLAFIWGRRYR
ncbi:MULTISPECIES: hypothetical protein [Bacillales]|jgi:hypothetical protein|uniref:T2SSF domain-containing protein n=1 Tax=Brevibacillus aydinogluensis TaxID=927786 RepID=A0AA48MAZ7_9BACL|nr:MULTISPECIES: hypothetical protein [Bacillales]REK67452.1 MAG: hypothetical protein DF221_02045 [Brevibacillus sp.]MBR8659832.1 hypothetical protein [Brevibacillus sp. NL20B1]MDT3418082.1 hypothetical protein [Brevibacillus aydinogluensis]NNV04254.1 hypothetical protein [Brevibacillus sp. MCWH]UFJ62352.1 hypothetical protein IRT44_05975 [Anoxybacillus sediminis]